MLHPRWDHQEHALTFARPLPATMLAMAMGTGKSRVVCDLIAEWQPQRTLIISPLSVLRIWRAELAKWGSLDWQVTILEKGSVARQQNDATLAYQSKKPVVFVQNYESVWRQPFGRWVLEKSWDLVVGDESHRFGSHRSKISRFLMQLAGKSRRRLCLSGTPLEPRPPLGCFGQYRFLDSRIFGRRWTPFIYSYAVRGNPAIPQMITGYRNLDILQERWGRIAYQVDSSVLDLLEPQHEVRSTHLPPHAMRLYRELERDFIAELEGGVVTAANALVKTLRLRQIVSGFIQLNGSPEITPVHYEKATLLAELLTDLGEAVVVFCEFRYDLKTVREVAESLGRRYGEISGDRKDLTDQGSMPEDIDVLGVQYQSGGLGIDLSRSHYCVLYSPTWSLGNYEQALARLHRPGQTGVRFYHFVCEGTVDQAVYKALADKREVIDSVLTSLRQRQEV